MRHKLSKRTTIFMQDSTFFFIKLHSAFLELFKDNIDQKQIFIYN